MKVRLQRRRVKSKHQDSAITKLVILFTVIATAQHSTYSSLNKQSVSEVLKTCKARQEP